MANKFPYVASAGPIIKTIDHLRRRSFPSEVTAETLRKLGVAPKNESFVINVLQFLGVIDGDGNKVGAKTSAFVQHKDEEFQREFETLVRDAYGELFDLYGDDAWEMDRASLVQFFRSSDHSSEIVGIRQASTFTCLAGLSGRIDLPQQRETAARKKSATEPPAKPAARSRASGGHRPPVNHEPAKLPSGNTPDQRVGLTVRIEVNLPADGDQDTYDNIFRSIRKNLIDVE